jgi:hypothetical protein
MSQPRVVKQRLGAAAILGGKGRGIGLGLAQRIVMNGRPCELSREQSRQLEARLLRQARAYG